ncbi:MAG: FtsW/RodA/SpoVE family cell cycle protein [Caldisericaceae bacterium]
MLILVLIIAVLLLTIVGLLMSFSISFSQSSSLSIEMFVRQIVYVVIGAGAVVFFAFFNHNKLRGFAKIFAIIIFILLLVLMVKGFDVSKRWIPIGVISIQPSQFAYIACVLLIARVFSGQIEEKNAFKAYAIVFIFVAIISLLIALEPDMGSAVVTFASAFLLLFISGMPVGEFLLFCLIMVLGGVLILPFSSEWAARIKAWLNPYAYQTTDGLQMLQSFRALARGGITGVGFMRSLLKFPGYLPVSSSDFVFAIFGEEIGLLGCVVLIVLYGVVAYVGFRIARKAKSNFSRLLALGLTIGILTWAIANMAVNVGLMPVTGVPLSFVSFGGNNMIANFISVGILINIARKEVS